jgi:V-type H+-transporting ATPase S1 subunit
MNSDSNNLIIVNLPSTPNAAATYKKSLRDIDSIIGSVTSQLEKLSKPFVAIYTASGAHNDDKNTYSWMADSHFGRQLLQDETTTSQPLDSIKPLAYVNGTFLLYVENMTINDGQNLIDYQTDGEYWSVSGFDNDTTNFNVTLNYNYNDSSVPSLNWTIMVNKTVGYWYVSAMQLNFRNEGSVDMMTTFIDPTPIGYSYSCTPATNISTTNMTAPFLTLRSYQIQAFSVKGVQFSHYNDCVGFFSGPIWMAIISCIVMVAILLFGVIMLLDINTMDRFDDPKGKTITITATD